MHSHLTVITASNRSLTK